MSPNAGGLGGGGGRCGVSANEYICAQRTWSPNKLRRSTVPPYLNHDQEVWSVVDFLTAEANKDSRSAFERVSFLGWFGRSLTESVGAPADGSWNKCGCLGGSVALYNYIFA